MTRNPRHRPVRPNRSVRPALLAAALAWVVPACGPAADDAPQVASADGSTAARGQYEPLTEGSAEDLGRHLAGLDQRYRTINERGPEQARAALLDYLDAVARTASALVSRQGLNPEIRDQAASIWLSSLGKLVMAEKSPAALERLLEAADSIIERFPKTQLATQAGFAKVEILKTAPPEIFADVDARFARLAGMALELGKLEPPHPKAAETLAELGNAADGRGDNDLALALYRTLTERFPDEPAASMVAGSIRRFEMEGQPVGELGGRNFQGEPVSLDDLKGKVVLVDFWATWCTPCVAELPELKRLRETLGPEGFEILGVCVDRDRKAIRGFLDSHELPWPQIIIMPESVPSPGSEDPLDLGQASKDAKPASGDSAQAEGSDEPFDPNKPTELELRFGLTLLPTKLVIDREGRLVTSGHELTAVLDDLERLFPGKDLKSAAPATPAEAAPGVVPASPKAEKPAG